MRLGDLRRAPGGDLKGTKGVGKSEYFPSRENSLGQHVRGLQARNIVAQPLGAEHGRCFREGGETPSLSRMGGSGLQSWLATYWLSGPQQTADP